LGTRLVYGTLILDPIGFPGQLATIDKVGTGISLETMSGSQPIGRLQPIVVEVQNG
jgi:hypothetical protein